MSDTVKFTVLGTAQPQGSVRAFMVKGKPRLTSDNAKLKPWRDRVGWAALEARNKQGWPENYEGVVCIFVRFFFAKPKSAKKRSDHTVKPDVDKLSRGLLDSLTGILFKDDAQVVLLHASKWYELPERTEIHVWQH
jgi:Holliday junction resolvase RusA-like endonuclease